MEDLEFIKNIFNQIELILGEDRAEEFLEVMLDLLKRADYEMPKQKFELRSLEIILNDYFHAKHFANGDALFKVTQDWKKVNAFDIIKENDVDIVALRISLNVAQYNCKEDGRHPLTPDEYDLLKEML